MRDVAKPITELIDTIVTSLEKANRRREPGSATEGAPGRALQPAFKGLFEPILRGVESSSRNVER